MKTFGKFVKTWWPTALTLAVVLYATLWPDPAGAPEMMWFPGADKLIHAVMMGGLASAVLFDMRRSGMALTRRRILLVTVVMTVFSVADEFVQKAMQLGRALEVADMVADTVGVIVASLTAPAVINRIFAHNAPKK